MATSSMFKGLRQTAKQIRLPQRAMGAAAGPGGAAHFHVSPYHSVTGKVLGTVMWLWVFYRTQQDGAVVLGLVHPWDNHHGDDHGHGHGHDDGHHEGPYQFEKTVIGAPPSLQ